jgi:SOS-response transcriptional repressor LexA
MTVGLTPRQAELVQFVRRSITVRGLSPSYREIQAELGMKSVSMVASLVDSTVERGALVRVEGRRRGLAPATRITIDPLPEVRAAIERYASQHQIAVVTAVNEALRAYFMESTT